MSKRFDQCKNPKCIYLKVRLCEDGYCTHCELKILKTKIKKLERILKYYEISKKKSRNLPFRLTLKGQSMYWEKKVPYTQKDLINHLQNLFTEGMTLENYGRWHIDHIIPRNKFHYTSYEDKDFKRCWDLSNLQPLWAEENINKIRK
jgi:hypothetical protein